MGEASFVVGTAKMPMLFVMRRALFAVEGRHQGIDFTCVDCAQTRASLRIGARISKKWERCAMHSWTWV